MPACLCTNSKLSLHRRDGMGGASSDSSCSYVPFSSQILLRLGTVLPDSANLSAGVLVRAIGTGFIALGGYTLMHLAQMTAEVELGSFCSATCTIDTLWCNLIGVIHLAPFLCYLDAHLVVVLHRGDASLTGRAVDATACNHFIHTTELLKFKEIKVCPAGILSIEMLLSTLPEAEALVDSVGRLVRGERIETDGLHAICLSKMNSL